MFYILVTFIVVFAAIILIFHLPGYQCFFLALIAALNPWAIQQCFVGLVDGALGSCLTMTFLILVIFLWFRCGFPC